MSKQHDRIIKARAHLIHKQPFFGTLALFLRLVEDEAVETMGTDGEQLIFAPSYVDQLDDPELRGVLVHEILHCAYQHHTRRGSRDPDQWNIAADYAINPIIIQAGFILPDGALLDAAYKGMGVEEIYKRRSVQLSSVASVNINSAVGPRVGTGKLGATTLAAPPSNAASAGAQQGGKALGQGGKVLDAAPASQPTRLSSAATEWQRRVRQAISVASGANRGTIPGDLEDLIQAIRKPVIDWRAELRRFIDSRCVVDYSWSSPNKRYLGLGFILPSVKTEGISKLGMVIDTSGSMNMPVLDKVFGEIASALDLGLIEELVVVQADTRVVKVDYFRSGDDIKFKAYGRGGTNFATALEWFSNNEPDVAALIYFTDLECDSFGKQPDCPLIWMTYGLESYVESRRKKIPFGEVLYINEEN